MSFPDIVTNLQYNSANTRVHFRVEKGDEVNTASAKYKYNQQQKDENLSATKGKMASKW